MVEKHEDKSASFGEESCYVAFRWVTVLTVLLTARVTAPIHCYSRSVLILLGGVWVIYENVSYDQIRLMTIF